VHARAPPRRRPAGPPHPPLPAPLVSCAHTTPSPRLCLCVCAPACTRRRAEAAWRRASRSARARSSRATSATALPGKPQTRGGAARRRSDRRRIGVVHGGMPASQQFRARSGAGLPHAAACTANCPERRRPRTAMHTHAHTHAHTRTGGCRARVQPRYMTLHPRSGSSSSPSSSPCSVALLPRLAGGGSSASRPRRAR